MTDVVPACIKEFVTIAACKIQKKETRKQAISKFSSTINGSESMQLTTTAIPTPQFRKTEAVLRAIQS